MTPYEAVREKFDFPFELRPYQVDEVNQLCQCILAGYYWEPGAGKTAGSTHQMLYETLTLDVQKWVLLMPPILIPQWAHWLRSIRDKRTGQPLSVAEYSDVQKVRRAMPLKEQFILTSYGLFKNDFEHLWNKTNHVQVGLNCDEATAIKNYETDNHRAVATFSEDRPLQLLTGTPLNKPGDAYGYLKLLAPGVYRNHRHFERMHVKEVDEYDRVTEWMNLDLLTQNMKINTSRILRRDVRKDLPPVIYTPLRYNLHPDHLAFYRRVAQDRLVSLDNGTGEVDAISSAKLRATLQQLVINWGHFIEDPDVKPAALELIEETLEELGDRKLVVVANFRRSNSYLHQALAQRHRAVAVYGDISPKNKALAVQRFITEPSCRVILVQPDSAGYGLDGLQHVCSDMLFVEAPTTPTPFTQVVARLDRDGQTEAVNCRVAMARGTVQVRMFTDLLDKDELVNSVQGSYQDLKEAIFGD